MPTFIMYSLHCKQCLPLHLLECRASSVCRMRPELRGQPLVPTQLLQALFSFSFQLAFILLISLNREVKVRLMQGLRSAAVKLCRQQCWLRQC